MKPYHIVTYPNPILKKKSKDIASFNSEGIDEIVSRMIVTLRASQGVGLAAPQIGKSLNLIVVLTKDSPLPIINPRITGKSILKNEGEEGCLSIPGVWGLVKRHNSIKVEGFNPAGEKIRISAKGFFARVIQHEIDHLNGILFIERTKKLFKEKSLENTSHDL
jgi:peptide deformylase